jgi:putative endonuclease
MSTERYYWVYILASAVGGTLYIGVTNNLVRRIYEHRNDMVRGFTKRYGVHRLVSDIGCRPNSMSSSAKADDPVIT